MGFVINAIYSMAYGLHNMQQALCPGYQVGTEPMDEWRDLQTEEKGKKTDEGVESTVGTVGPNQGTTWVLLLDYTRSGFHGGHS